jgi:transposase InsO family protein
MKTYVVGETLDRVALDLLGPVAQTYSGNKYLLVVTDYFTRYAEAYAIPDIEAKTVAEKLVTEFICRYGVPVQIHTDQGSQFTSALFQEMCKILHIDKTRNSPFHPQSSGLVEKLNGTIEDMLSKVISKNQKDWDTFLPFLMLAYRSSLHDTLGESPNTMMFGREVLMPVDLLFGKTSQLKDVSTPEYVHNLTNRMDKVHDIVRDRFLKAADRQKRRYDLTCNTREYKVGDGVLLQDNRKYEGRSPKLQNKWEGLYTITSKISDLCIEYKKDYIPDLKLYT